VVGLVIGAGAAGTMAAWRLADTGHQVTVLEQFKIDHDRGSSFGESRIVRRVYTDPLYTGLMAEAYELWDELQEKWRNSCPSGPDSDEAELINRSGGLFFGPIGNPDVVAAQSALQQNGVEYENLTAEDVHARFPEFTLPPNTLALFEPTMGFARASNAIGAAAFFARMTGVSIIEDTAVTRIEQVAGGLLVTAENGQQYRVDRVLITAGAWTIRFLAQPGTDRLKITRQVYIHLAQHSETDRFVAGRFPTWIDIGTNMYGFPRIGKSEGVKIASHDRGIAVDPESVDRSVSPKELENILRYASSHFEGLTDKVVYVKVCLYTNTPDEDFIIDEAPNLPGAYIISACSGHGFKFAPLIGQIGAELVHDGAQNRDLSRFRLSRLRTSIV